jgi:putative ABC transport system permease protein
LIRPQALVYLYRRRLRAHAAQELLAALGVAIAVALVFAVLVANGSIAGSTAEVVHTVVGPASLQVRSRGPEGFSEQLLGRVERLPGVQQAAPALEQMGTIVAAGGRRETLDIVGTDVSLAILDGLAHTLPAAVFAQHGIALSEVAAGELGISPSRVKEGAPAVVSVNIRGNSHPLKVSAVLGHEAAAALSQTTAALMPLRSLQRLAGLRGRISRILVEARAGRRAAVRAELQRLSAGRLEVAAADADVALLRQALHPSNQASTFFAVIAALLGFLFAFNAMLLTVPERRQAIADLRIDGAKRSAIVEMVLFEALCLGLAASIGGLLIGYVLSRGVFHESTGYLTQAFVLGGNTVIGVQPVLFAIAGGVLATVLASAIPLLDLRRGRAIDAVYFEDGAPGNALGRRIQRRLSAAAVALIVPATLIYVLMPSAALVAVVMIALATVLAVPLMLAAVLQMSTGLPTRLQRLAVLPVAITSLRATTVRSLALAATGSVALFGCIALSGARNDLLAGLHGVAEAHASGAAVWVVNQNDPLAVNSFTPGASSADLARIPGVTSISAFHSEYLDVGGRRIWLLARPAGATLALLRREIVSGSAATAARRLAEGGWVVVSQQLAAEHDVSVGGVLILPTPTGATPFRVAATTTNLGWVPGAIVLSSADYQRFWATSAPSALGVTLSPGTNTEAAQDAISQRLGSTGGLEALSAEGRAQRFDAIAAEGLGRLAEISTLLMVAAVLALAAALGSSIWQRRTSLSGLRLEGASPAHLRRILLAESLLMLVAGCLTGVIAGTYGQVVMDGYLKHVTGFPVEILAARWLPIEILAVVVAVTAAITAAPGWSASHVSPALALESE